VAFLNPLHLQSQKQYHYAIDACWYWQGNETIEQFAHKRDDYYNEKLKQQFHGFTIYID
jgi:hypothetical protein